MRPRPVRKLHPDLEPLELKQLLSASPATTRVAGLERAAPAPVVDSAAPSNRHDRLVPTHTGYLSLAIRSA